MMNRKEPRVPAALRICCTETGGEKLETYTTHLGGGGCFIITGSPPKEGTPLHLEFTLPTFDTPLRVMGKVAWRRTEFEGSRPIGVGVAFSHLSPGDKAEIRGYIDAVLSRRI